MKNKGFTLVELLGVLVVLAVLGVIVSQNIIDRVKQNNKQLSELSKQVLISSARDYVYNNESDFEKVDGATYCIDYNTMIETEYLNEGMLPEGENIEDLKNGYVKVKYINDSYTYEVVSECNSF